MSQLIQHSIHACSQDGEVLQFKSKLNFEDVHYQEGFFFFIHTNAVQTFYWNFATRIPNGTLVGLIA